MCRYRLWLIAIFLPLYIGVALWFFTPAFEGDEGRYVEFAQNLSRGFYSPPGVVKLWSGPGYPLVLMPLAWLQATWVWGVVLNALMLTTAVIYFSHIATNFISRRAALYLAVFYGLYPPFLRELSRLISETLAILLMTAFVYHCISAVRHQKVRYDAVLAGLFFGALCLTKVIFGYLALIGLGVALVVAMISRTRRARVCLVMASTAMGLCLPYLLYVYSLTGKIFYWSTAGGLQLYCMTSSGPGELGSWYTSDLGLAKDFPQIETHREFLTSLIPLSEVDKDAVLTREALRNIRATPLLYLKRIGMNVGRLLFSYPYSFTPQSPQTFFYLIPNMFLVVLGLCTVVPAVRLWRAVPLEMWLLLGVFFCGFGVSSLVSAYERQFRPLVPLLATWLLFAYSHLLRIELRYGAEQPPSQKG